MREGLNEMARGHILGGGNHGQPKGALKTATSYILMSSSIKDKVMLMLFCYQGH